jgi:hypothetical protein
MDSDRFFLAKINREWSKIGKKSSLKPRLRKGQRTLAVGAWSLI